MSTEFRVDGHRVALRYSGGKERGSIMEVEYTKDQFESLVKTHGNVIVDETGFEYTLEEFYEDNKHCDFGYRSQEVWDFMENLSQNRNNLGGFLREFQKTLGKGTIE